MKAHFFSLAFLGFSILTITVASCTKNNPVLSTTNPGTGGGKVDSSGNGNNGNSGNGNTGTHPVNPQLIGTWLWTQASDAAYFDNNGVYNGAASGLARQYTINADGTGSCFDHLYSTIGAGTGLTVDISSTGFFETDDQGHLGYFPLKGTYRSSSGDYHNLGVGEVYDPSTRSGRVVLYQKLVVTTQGDRVCFQVTSSDEITDTFFKIK